MKRRIAALLAGGLALLPAAAFAEEEAFSLEDFLAEPRDYAIEEIAADLTYGYCPLYLVGQFPLTGNAMLTERGFGQEIARTTNPAGELELVLANRPDGTVTFGGRPMETCSVVVTDADLDTVLVTLRESMAFMGLDFQPAPEGSEDVPHAAIESYKAPLDGQVLYVQLARVVEPGSGKSAVAAQVFGGAE